MDPGDRPRRFVSVRMVWWVSLCLAAIIGAMSATRSASAACGCGKTWPHLRCAHRVTGHVPTSGDITNCDTGGTWYWVRSPEQEQRVTMNLYNRYCIRCHGVDGRGVWDIPDVPDFTSPVWQATRPDAYRSRVILEGRGAVMPAFRGTITLEESCALARYLYTFVPGTEVSRPVPEPTAPVAAPAVNPPAAASPPPVPPTPSPFTR